MNGDKLAQSFSRDLDDILDGKTRSNTDGAPPEYEKALMLVSLLKEADFSEGGARERIRQRFMNCIEENNRGYFKGVSMNKLFNKHRPALVFGTVVIAAFLGLTLAFPGTMLALVDNVGANITRILKLGSYATVIQIENPSPGNAVLSDEEKEILQQEGTITKQTPGGELSVSLKSETGEGKPQEGTVTYTSLDQAQEAVSFKMLIPEYLPSGYSFKEAQGYEGSDKYINLYFKGTGKDITLLQRVMSDETRFGFATNGPVEPVEINGAAGAWMEPHTLMWEKDGVVCSLFCSGFSKEEAVKIAGSVR